MPAELTGIELGISGLAPFLVTFQPLGGASAVLGSPELDLYGRGGVNVAWPSCLAGDRALLRITLKPRAGWPQEASLTVHGREPPSNPYQPYALITRCDVPLY